MPQNRIVVIWNKAGVGRGNDVLGLVGGRQMCPDHHSKSGNSSLDSRRRIVLGLPGSRVM